MKQCLVRSCSVGASSILAVAVVGLAASPAFAGTPRHTASVHGQQSHRTLSAPARPGNAAGSQLRSDALIHIMKPGPRMC
jgi:hypothetical protein